MTYSSALKVVGANILILLAGLVVVELTFGTWFSAQHALYQFTKPRNLLIEQKNPLANGRERIRYTRDGNGLRGLHAPVSQIDLITVGGSTTDQRWIDDEETFQAVMVKRFREDGRAINIANAGIDGQSTIGHIHIFPSWFQKIDGFRGRYVLFYVGVNDIYRAQTPAAPDVTTAQSALLRAQLYIREKSALYQIYLVARRSLLDSRYSHGFSTTNFALGEDLATKGLHSGYDTPQFVAGLEALGERVRSLSRLTRDMGAAPIFVTQRSARWRRVGGRVLGIQTYAPDFHAEEFKLFGRLNGVDIYNIERKVADAIIDACRASNAICLDLMADVDFDLPADYYDPIHTTPSGSRLIGEYLYRRLKDQL